MHCRLKVILFYMFHNYHVMSIINKYNKARTLILKNTSYNFISKGCNEIIFHLYYCFRYLQEYTALGTAGGLYHFRDQILAGKPDSFFVMNSDVCGDFPLKEMLSFTVQKGGGSHCTVLGTEV